MTARAGLAWVLADGRPVHVSRFAGLVPRARPAVHCPECQRPLILKLGKVLRHHAAHAPGHTCPAVHPETALHLDLKFHLAALLSAGRESGPLRILERCAGSPGQPCPATLEREWVRGWDEVAVETRLGTGSAGGRRPDILLSRGGAPVGAIEVRVSNAVSVEKAAALAGDRVPWIEVVADAALIEGEGAWSLGHSLPVCRSDALQGDAWRCERHAVLHRHREADLAGRRAAEAEAARHDGRLRLARVVDVYGSAGARERVIFRVEEVRLDGVLQGLELRAAGRVVAFAPAGGKGGSLRSAWESLRATCADEVRRLADAAGGFADSPMRWARGMAAENLVHEALTDIRPGDATPLATRYPRRWRFARQSGQWFMPREMRHVRWDRGDDDAFAPHPAWLATRAKVRETPVQPAAWRGLVFAARPTLGSFGPGVRVDERFGAEPGLTVLQPRLENDAPAGLHGSILVLLTAAVLERGVRKLAAAITAAGITAVWLSHPRDWSPARADLAWAAAGRDARGVGCVVVDGDGVYRAEQFAGLVARGDRKVAAERIRDRMAARVGALPVR